MTTPLSSSNLSAKTEPSPLPSPLENFAASNPVTILVVEDNEVNMKFIIILLLKLGYENISTAVNGLEAVNFVKKTPVDIILMDLQMPVMDGFEATRQILEFEKSARPTKKTYIAAVTASVSADIQAQCQNVGMDYYMTKPISLYDLAAGLIYPWPDRVE